MNQDVAVELTGYECMYVLTNTSKSIRFRIEAFRTIAVEATVGIETLSILLTHAFFTLIDICRHIVDMCTYNT